MTPPPLHIDGPSADRVAWSAEPSDDGVDWSAMEDAMIEARRESYEALSDLDAA